MLTHITVDTGDTRRYVRPDDAMVAFAATILRRALHRPVTPEHIADLARSVDPIGVDVLDQALDALHPVMFMPARSRYAQWSLRSAASGHSLLGTVYGPPLDIAPVLSFGVSPGGDHDLWDRLTRNSPDRRPVAPLLTPSGPWLATRMEIGAALVRDLAIFPILADMQRCVAWAWIAEWPA